MIRHKMTLRAVLDSLSPTDRLLADGSAQTGDEFREYAKDVLDPGSLDLDVFVDGSRVTWADGEEVFMVYAPKIVGPSVQELEALAAKSLRP